MKLKLTLIAAAALAVASLPALAHHSFAAEYDSSKPVTIIHVRCHRRRDVNRIAVAAPPRIAAAIQS